MTKIIFLSFLFFPCIFFDIVSGQVASPPSSKGNLVIHFKNIQLGKGSVKVALYNSAETFLDPEKATAYYSFAVHEAGTLTATIENVEHGEYAIAVFHDENDNGELETNFFGIPTEPYCFSGSGHSRWKPPVFEDARFVVAETEVKLSLRLERWRL